MIELLEGVVAFYIFTSALKIVHDMILQSAYAHRDGAL